jgi:uncharacterized RDD family membrane protein YckC
VDPEAFEPSEQRFSASLTEESTEQRARFVLDDEANPETLTEELRDVSSEVIAGQGADSAVMPEVSLKPAVGEDTTSAEPTMPEDPDAWRREVAARLDRYRSRRKVKAPRYPSLRLKFDPPEQTWNATSSMSSTDQVSPSLRSGTSTMAAPSYASRQSAALERMEPEVELEADAALRIEEVAPLEAPDSTAKIIEFPRSYIAPVRLDELADPVTDRPRIVEAAEVVPPPPAMGGILMAPAEQEEPERRPGFEIPLQSAPLGRRICAAAIDLMIVLSGVATFGFVVYQLAGAPLPPLKIAEVGMGVTAIFWSIYQYMLLVYNGSTPGLRSARLQLRRFDGRPVVRRVRRWRVITSVLSGLSLGMGYAWSFLDEDALCWHDRITHTYLEPKPKKLKTA